MVRQSLISRRRRAKMAAAQVGPTLSNGLQPLSCQRCSLRKVRCNRIFPCSNCIKHDVHCTFSQPKTERRQRRKVALPSPSSRDKPRQRLDRNARMLKGSDADVELASDLSRGVVADVIPSATTAPQEINVSNAAAGRLVVDGARSRYVEGNLWTRMEQDVRNDTTFGNNNAKIP